MKLKSVLTVSLKQSNECYSFLLESVVGDEDALLKALESCPPYGESSADLDYDSLEYAEILLIP